MSLPRGRLLFALAGAAAVLLWVWTRVPRSPTGPAPSSGPVAADAPAPTGGPPAPTPAAAASRPPAADGAAGAPSSPALPPGFEPGDPAVAWSQVDLDAVRAALPDNRYWTEQMPTDDAALREARAEEADRVRALRTRVESGHASAEEVDAYYARQREVYGDGIEFSSHLLEHYGDVLNERSRGLLEVALRLHRGRLLELPRDQARAHDRRARLDAAREAWRAQQEAFAGVEDGPSRTPAD